VLTVLAPFVWVLPDWRVLALGTLIGCAATTGHWLIVLAFRYAGAAILAPFTYMQLVWSTGLGILVFGAIPDEWTIVGATVVVLSGLYTAHREQVRSRERAMGGGPSMCSASEAR
jgi:drug/metabolite transporter (DMT)-like permease